MNKKTYKHELLITFMAHAATQQRKRPAPVNQHPMKMIFSTMKNRIAQLAYTIRTGYKKEQFF